ncbi:MAG: hypothetical protein HY286_12910 [Planctomycetes bacterium]|nr:hypothetical protein [Planctomycetota bacterium]
MAARAVLAFLTLGSFVSAFGIAQNSPVGEWKRREGYGVLVESGPLGAPATRRELVWLMRDFHGRIPTSDLLVFVISPAAGGCGAAYRVEIREGTQQPRNLEPMAFHLDAKNQAFRVQSDGQPVELEKLLAAARDEAAQADAAQSRPAPGGAFVLLRIPDLNGSIYLPYMHPATEGSEPSNNACGVLLQIGSANGVARSMRQFARRSDSGDWMVDYRNEGGQPLIIQLQMSRRDPLPVWGQIFDSERGEHTRFRLVARTGTFTKTASFGRVSIVGDPMLINPELLDLVDSQWDAGLHDLCAEEAADSICKELGLSRADARQSLQPGEVVPFGYELFAVNAGVATGDTTKKKVNDPKSGISPRGAVGTVFVGRYEDPKTRLHYEAWLVPGADERARETDAPNPVGESPGRLLLRFVLGNATSRLLADRGLQLRLDPNWYKIAATRAANERPWQPIGGLANNKNGKNNKKAPPPPPQIARRGSDAILIRRENDFAPVALVFYRISEDLRSSVPFAEGRFENNGPAAVVRRSLLDRAKDFFLSGGFTAFTTKKGAAFLLTRALEEGTVVDRMEHGCGLELLEETALPEEPWKLAHDPRNGKNSLWGTPVTFSVGRNRYGDSRVSRDGIIRRTDGEEVVAYESWEIDRPWWSEAIAAYPQQGVGVRFRPLVHGKLNDVDANGNVQDDDILPFEPPPPPPQPKGNPVTPRPTPSPAKPKPKPQNGNPKPPAPPPPTPSGPKTGG